MFYTLFVILIVLASILMIGIVLIQESKGGGLSSNFSSSNSFMSVHKTTDLVEKVTWGLAIAMVVLSVVCTWVAPSSTANQSVIENQSTTTNTATPGFGASEQQAPAQGATGNQGASEGAKQTAPAQGATSAPAQGATSAPTAQPAAPTPAASPAK
nr:preprotein translocase subunit SecG [Prevotella sp.]